MACENVLGVYIIEPIGRAVVGRANALMICSGY
jgi:hypothetical protein